MPQWKADAAARIVLSVIFIALAMALAMALTGAKNFMVNYENFLALLLCVMAPCIPLEQLPLEYERLLGGESGFLKTSVRF